MEAFYIHWKSNVTFDNRFFTGKKEIVDKSRHLTQVGVYVYSSSYHSHPFLFGGESRAPALGRRARRGLAQRHDRRGGMGDHQLNPDHDRQLVEYLRFLRRKRDTAIAEVAAEFKEVNESRLFEESYSADEVANILEGLLTSACARRSRRHPAHTKAGTTAA